MAEILEGLANACEVQGVELKLNGSGVRRLFLIEVYRCYLYSREPASSALALARMGTPIRLVFRFSYGPIAAQRLRKAWRDAFESSGASPNGEVDAAAFHAFMETVSDSNVGDLVCYDICGDTVEISTNSMQLASIRSHTLAKGIIDVVVGENPIDPEMKMGLLGGAQESSRSGDVR